MSDDGFGLAFSLDGRRSFNDVARVLGRIDRSIPREIGAAIQAEAKALQKEARARIMEEPTLEGSKHTGIREEIAAGVTVKALNEGDLQGYRIETEVSEENQAYLPRGFDTRSGWRHPVFGNRKAWVRQRAAFSWFMDTMDAAGPALIPAVGAIVNDAAEQVRAVGSID